MPLMSWCPCVLWSPIHFSFWLLLGLSGPVSVQKGWIRFCAHYFQSRWIRIRRMYHYELVSVTLLCPRSPPLACLLTAASLMTVSPDSTFCQGNAYLLLSVLELLFCRLLRCLWKPFSCSKACATLEVQGYEVSLGQLLTKRRRKQMANSLVCPFSLQFWGIFYAAFESTPWRTQPPIAYCCFA